MTYLKSITFLASSALLFTACGKGTPHVPESKGGFYYSGIYFGKNFSETLKEGVRDGCETSKGHYKKKHEFFNSDTDYNTGWFLGRSRCIPLFKVEEDDKPAKKAE